MAQRWLPSGEQNIPFPSELRIISPFGLIVRIKNPRKSKKKVNFCKKNIFLSNRGKNFCCILLNLNIFPNFSVFLIFLIFKKVISKITKKEISIYKLKVLFPMFYREKRSFNL